jgi:hypothetical protein
MELSFPTTIADFPCCAPFMPVRAAIITPVEPSAAYLARFTDGGDLPRYSGGSAPTLALSRSHEAVVATGDLAA